MIPITISPEITEIQNHFMTAFPNHFSQNLPAIDHFTKLFDITAIRIVDEAKSIGREPSAVFDAIS
jgi:hypothetical protein